MHYLNSPFLTLLTLAAFIWLAYSATQHEKGYKTSDIDAVNRIAGGMIHSVKEKPLTKTQRDKAFAQLFEEK